MIGVSQPGQNSRFATISIGPLAVTFAAGQWYLYDAVHQQAESFRYYWLTLAYLSGVLCPLVVWLSRRWPIDVRTWKRSVAIHVPVSIAITLVGVFVEGAIGWYSRRSPIIRRCGASLLHSAYADQSSDVLGSNGGNPSLSDS